MECKYLFPYELYSGNWWIAGGNTKSHAGNALKTNNRFDGGYTPIVFKTRREALQYARKIFTFYKIDKDMDLYKITKVKEKHAS